MNSMPEINPTNLQTPGTGLNRQDKSSQDKTEFASFIHREYSKSADRNSDEKKINSDSTIKEDAGSKGESSVCGNCTSDMNDSMYSAARKSERQETVYVEPGKSDDDQKKDEVHPEHGLKTGTMLFSLLQSYMAEQGNASPGSTGDVPSDESDTAEGASESGSAAGNGLKVGTLLHNMISSHGAENGGGVNPVQSGEQDTGLNAAESSASPAGNGLKVGTLLHNVISSYAAENGGGVNPVPSGEQAPGLSAAASTATPAGNGLKVGTLLHNVISNYVAENGGGVNPVPSGEQGTGLDAAESSASPAENGLKVGTLLNDLGTSYKGEIEEGAESGKVASDTHSENGLKMGELLNRLAGRSDEAEINKGSVKEEMVSAEKPIEIKAEIDGSKAESVVFGEEVSGEAETKSRTSAHIEKVYSEDRIKNVDILKTNDNVDIPETNDNAEGLNSRLSTVLSEHFKQDNGTEDRTFNLPKGTHNSGNDAETNNINSINTSNITSENTRSVQGLSAFHTAKTPAAQELLDNVVYVIKSNSKMGVSVEHEILGKLNISLSLEKGLVNVHINTSDRVVRELLENNIQQIIDTLNKDGVSVGEFSLALRDQKEHEINRFSLKNGQGREIPIDTKKATRHSGLVNIFA